MRPLDDVFKLLYQGYLATWGRTENPHHFAASSIKTAYTTIFFFFLLVPSYKLFLFAYRTLRLHLPKFMVVFGPMITAFLIGWLLSLLYYDRVGKDLAMELEARKLTSREKIQTFLLAVFFIAAVSGWSLLIAMIF